MFLSSTEVYRLFFNLPENFIHYSLIITNGNIRGQIPPLTNNKDFISILCIFIFLFHSLFASPIVSNHFFPEALTASSNANIAVVVDLPLVKPCWFPEITFLSVSSSSNLWSIIFSYSLPIVFIKQIGLKPFAVLWYFPFLGSNTTLATFQYSGNVCFHSKLLYMYNIFSGTVSQIIFNPSTVRPSGPGVFGSSWRH